MNDDQLMRLLFLGILGSVIALSLVVQNRHRLGAMVQQAAIWGLIFVGGVVVYGLWEDIARTAMPRQTVIAGDGGASVVEIPRSRDGHYHMVLDVNGAPLRFVVDTGASDLVLTSADAELAGVDMETLRFTGRAQTANGQVRTADVWLDAVALGGVVDRDVRAVVNEGEMQQSLLGMSYLQHFGRIEIENDRLRLIR
ncbi:TIGR02281 family clan AA aspartic protease [Jannaschia sp. W003]|uniref:retropepsin-like aspartic protease family protein n=1 Tax=Jannaschia sp. W003 TaxID=2867012 RepID=UPI0021A3E940|nr:TIGR02281 family clan AA aspartic protease [Jannaschia sp. W003]UWQ20812.1 TIGR02281 family clan AA aspartic protease [Jannaschia sp. W003]